MESLVFALNATMPIVFTVAIGYILKRTGIMSMEFAKMANRIVFRVFLPVMLFMNVYAIDDLSRVDFGYVLYSLSVILIIFLLGIPAVILITASPARRGALLQSFFRSNMALIGVPLADLLFGTEGVIAASILSAVMVPIFNIIAVVALTMFNKDEGENRKGAAFYVKKILLGIAKNPLLWAIALGFAALGIRALLDGAGIDFRLSSVTPIWKTMGYLSGLATPLALIALGGQFEFSVIGELRREIIAGSLVRILIMPIIGLGVAYLLFRDSFSGAQFAAMLTLFCTPVAVSSVPMAQEMGSDSRLAGQLVVFTTMLSSISIFVAAFILKFVGIF